MRIQRLALRDFGIFRDQILESIGSGIVVVGGPNRAGKTSLMQALRYLVYGFPRSGLLPPPNREYDVDADLVLDGGDVINVQLTGFSKPKFTKIPGGTDFPFDHLLTVDAFTYQQVFTISLDELRRLPEGVSSSESQKLQSVLLGAGLADLVQIPGICHEFRKRASDIGGKNGSPGVKAFKPFNQRIKEGLEQRSNALKQVEEYGRKRRELEQMENRIRSKESELFHAQQLLIVLDVLKRNYGAYERFLELRRELNEPHARQLLANFPIELLDRAGTLKEQYTEAIEVYDGRLSEFRQATGSREIEKTMDCLIAHAEELRARDKQLSGLKQRVEHFLESCKEHKTGGKEIRAGMAAFNEAWEGDFDRVKQIRCDELTIEAAVTAAGEWEDAFRELEDAKSRLADLRKEHERLQGKIREARIPAGTTKTQNLYLGLFAGIFLLGVLVSPVNLWIGAFTGISAITGITFMILKRYESVAAVRTSIRSLNEQLEDLAGRIRDAETSLHDLQARLNSANDTIEHYRRVLGIAPDVSPRMIPEILRNLQELKRRIAQWEYEAGWLNTERAALLRELNSLDGLVRELGYGDSFCDPLQNSDEIFERVEEAVSHLSLAERLFESARHRDELEKQILEIVGAEGLSAGSPSDSPSDLIAKLDSFVRDGDMFKRLDGKRIESEKLSQGLCQSFSDRVQKAFEYILQSGDRGGIGDGGSEICTNAPEVSLFDAVYRQYVSIDEVTRVIHRTEDRIAVLEGELKTLREDRTTLRDDLNRLSTTEKLEQAQFEIDEARAGLMPLALEFAVYNVAAFILDRVYNGFIEKTKGELLRKASGIFDRLTAGDYTGILPSDDLSKPDFKVVAADGRCQDTTEILSRGTREELFFAVRLGRIQEIQPPLPVILDDSLINFDPSHRRRAVEIVRDLARTHQVFVLTCHPEIVEYLSSGYRNVQYWKLDDGCFSPAEQGELIEFMRGGVGRKRGS